VLPLIPAVATLNVVLFALAWTLLYLDVRCRPAPAPRPSTRGERYP